MKGVISVDTIDELIDEAVTQGMIAMQLSMGDGLPGRHDKVIEKTKASLHSLLISKLPEKHSKAGGDTLDLEANYARGRNSAIDDMKSVLAEMFEVKNATS